MRSRSRSEAVHELDRPLESFSLTEGRRNVTIDWIRQSMPVTISAERRTASDMTAMTGHDDVEYHTKLQCIQKKPARSR